MKKITLFASVVCSMICIFLLFLCKNSNFKFEKIETGDIGYNSTTKEWEGKGESYILKPVNNSGYSLSVGIYGDDIYYLEIQEQGKYCVVKNGKAIYLTNNCITAICASEENIWIAESAIDGQKIQNSIKALSDSGNVIKIVEIDNARVKSTCISSLFYLYGQVYAIFDNQLLVLDEGGKLLYFNEMPLDEPYLVLGGDEKMYVVESSSKHNRIFCIDVEAQKVAPVLSCARGAIHSGENTNFLLLTTNDGLYRINCDGSVEPIMLCRECNISFTGLTKIYSTGNRNYICCISGKILNLTQVLPEKVVQKEKLTIAAIGSPYTLTHIVSNFNIKNDKYYADIIDYSNSGFLSFDKALSKLNAEIKSGNCPDMICFSSISPFLFIKNGLLIDLKGFFDHDNSISLNSVVIRKALESNDQIFFLDNSFCIETVIGKKSIFGNTDGWTLSQYLNIEKNIPPDTQMIYNMTRETFLFYASSRYVQQAINWQTGTCELNTIEFANLLKVCNQIKETPDDLNNPQYFDAATEVANGRMIAASVFLTNICELAQREDVAGCQLSYIGWPSIDGSNGSDIWMFEPVGIMAASSNKSGCWEFIKYMLQFSSYDNYGSDIMEYGLPVFLPRLEERITAIQYSKECQVEISEDYINRLMNLIYEIDTLALYDQSVLKIIQKESDKYFNGRNTPEKAAEIIESKINTYLSKQYG